MPRLFTAASSEYLEAPTAAVSAVPFTLACFFYQVAAATQALISIANNAVADQNWALEAVSTSKVRVAAQGSGDANSTQDTTNVFGLNRWNHAAGVFSTSALRTPYLNGIAGPQVSQARGAITPNVTAIGRLSVAAPALFYGGQIAHVGIWNAVLTPLEIWDLAQGARPDRIRPQNLVYYKEIGEPNDAYGKLIFTPTGTLVKPDPFVIRSRTRRRAVRLSGGGSGTIITPPQGIMEMRGEIIADWNEPSPELIGAVPI